MRVFITGNKGYIGAVMTPMLLAAGHEVVGLDSDLYRDCTFGDEPLEAPTLYKDIREVTPDDLAGFDAVIHLAALSNDPLGNLDRNLTLSINYAGSVHLARMAKQAGVSRFLFSSSCSLYGAGGNDMLTEEAAFNPVTVYGETKVMAEHDIAALADDGFSPTFFRNATAYGLSPRHRFDLVLNNLMAWAVATGNVHIKSDGTPWRPIVHIEDISAAYLAALAAPRAVVHNQAVNVGANGENYRIRELATIVQETVPGSQVTFAADASPDLRNYRVNFDKIGRLLPAFQPQWTARRGAQQLYEAYRRLGVTLEEFEGPKYRRVDHIKQLLAAGEIDSTLRRTAPIADKVGV